jgi:hypothetical protein
MERASRRSTSILQTTRLKFVGETSTREATLLSIKQEDPPPGTPPGHFYVALQIATLVANSYPPEFVGCWSDVGGNSAEFHMTRL